jgi:hypothetical protein
VTTVRITPLPDRNAWTSSSAAGVQTPAAERRAWVGSTQMGVNCFGQTLPFTAAGLHSVAESQVSHFRISETVGVEIVGVPPFPRTVPQSVRDEHGQNARALPTSQARVEGRKEPKTRR